MFSNQISLCYTFLYKCKQN